MSAGRALLRVADENCISDVLTGLALGVLGVWLENIA